MTEHPTGNSIMVIYGRDSCPQSRLLRNSLEKDAILYEWRDIVSGDTSYKDELRELTGGNLSVPTVVFPDGSVLIEPWPKEVLKKLNPRSARFLNKVLSVFKKSNP